MKNKKVIIALVLVLVVFLLYRNISQDSVFLVTLDIEEAKEIFEPDFKLPTVADVISIRVQLSGSMREFPEEIEERQKLSLFGTHRGLTLKFQDKEYSMNVNVLDENSRYWEIDENIESFKTIYLQDSVYDLSEEDFSIINVNQGKSLVINNNENFSRVVYFEEGISYTLDSDLTIEQAMEIIESLRNP